MPKGCTTHLSRDNKLIVLRLFPTSFLAIDIMCNICFPAWYQTSLEISKFLYCQQPLSDYFTVTKEKPFQVNVYKVQKSDKEVFKKKQTWPLSDLKIVDGKAEHEVLYNSLNFNYNCSQFFGIFGVFTPLNHLIALIPLCHKI